MGEVSLDECLEYAKRCVVGHLEFTETEEEIVSCVWAKLTNYYRGTEDL